MSRNYEAPNNLSINRDALREWAVSRETAMVVAAAIHAIADSSRTADAIWEAPTAAEWQHVEMAVAEYIAHGDFSASEDGRYFWGQETVTVPL